MKIILAIFRAESMQLKQELETQPLSVEQRTKLLDEVDYALRVQDSKRSLAEQIGKVNYQSNDRSNSISNIRL